ncbi:MAG: transcription antitermination factor NusB, partial [Pseudomonadota bacterium]
MATHTEDQDGAQAPTSKAQRKRARRSAARLSAVQALYQMDIAKTDLNQVIHEFTHIRTDKADAKRRAAEREAAGAGAAPDDTQPTPARQAVPAGARDADADPDALSTVIGTADHTYFAEILRGVVRLQRTIDPEVDKQLATGWRLARVDSILRQTLRAAAFELIERQEVPARAVISEYIDVA